MAATGNPRWRNLLLLVAGAAALALWLQPAPLWLTRPPQGQESFSSALQAAEEAWHEAGVPFSASEGPRIQALRPQHAERVRQRLQAYLATAPSGAGHDFARLQLALLEAAQARAAMKRQGEKVLLLDADTACANLDEFDFLAEQTAAMGRAVQAYNARLAAFLQAWPAQARQAGLAGQFLDEQAAAEGHRRLLEGVFKLKKLC